MAWLKFGRGEKPQNPQGWGSEKKGGLNPGDQFSGERRATETIIKKLSPEEFQSKVATINSLAKHNSLSDESKHLFCICADAYPNSAEASHNHPSGRVVERISLRATSIDEEKIRKRHEENPEYAELIIATIRMDMPALEAGFAAVHANKWGAETYVVQSKENSENVDLFIVEPVKPQ